jgi:hypothetical protein
MALQGAGRGLLCAGCCVRVAVCGLLCGLLCAGCCVRVAECPVRVLIPQSILEMQFGVDSEV